MHLVIRGDHQIEGFDYNEIFAPMEKMANIHCLLSVATARNWELYNQLDVNIIFLHGDLDKEVYTTLLPSFSIGSPHRDCKL